MASVSSGTLSRIHAPADVFKSLLHESVELYRYGRIKFFPPPQIFDISDVVKAFRAVSLSSRIGKIAVSLENPDSVIPVSGFP